MPPETTPKFVPPPPLAPLSSSASAERAASPSTCDAAREMEMAREVITGLEEQCARANRRAAAYRDELEQERRTIASLRRCLAELTEGLRARPAKPVWSAPEPVAPSIPAPTAGQRPTVRLAAVS